MTNATESPEFAILVVDDEPNIVSAIRRELNTPPLGAYRYAVEGFSDPQQALERAREKSFAVVVSDYRMPEMSGLDFLNALHEIQPDCVHIVLSGQTDMDALVRMVNETHIYRFIPKPWSSYFLKSSIIQAIKYRQVTVQNRQMADALRAQGVSLPENPDTASHVLIVDDDINVCHAIARDLKGLPVNVQVSTSATEALRMAEDVDFSCVIADYKMPGMDGVELLEAFAGSHPDCALILLSGAAGMDEVISAIDLAHIHAFIAKPWNDFALRTSVAQGIVRRKLKVENESLAALCRARNLDCPAA
jgi:DNA-binding NtrC family response regulator